MLDRYKNDCLSVLLILIISIFFVLDLFIHQGQPVTFDGPTHISNIAQFYHGMTQGDFPVRWGDGFARYGMPIPLIAQQTTSYLGAIINLFTQNVLLSYNVVVFIGALVSSLLFYYFLRFYTKPIYALTGTVVFHFAPYRIMNVYIRGALPEFFSSVFIILILIALYKSLEKRQLSGYLLLALSVAFLLLTHPFMFVVSCFLTVPYGLFLLWKKPQKLVKIIILISSIGLGFGLAAYYLVPLFLEVKYFYYGLAKNHFAQGHFLGAMNYLTERWFYFYNGDIFPRGHVHQSGIIETVTLIFGILYFLVRRFQKKKTDWLLGILLLSAFVVIFFTLSFSNSIYQNITILGNIQHPWRMLTAFIFIPAIVMALLLEKINNKLLPVICIIAVIWLRIPQLYGKNYTNYPQSVYFNTEDNLHGVIMNTIWTGQVREYPFQKNKAKIIEGTAKIINSDIKNSYREYKVVADSDVRLVDYTFYFPGWKVFIDGQEKEIQFQDPEYRGVITYNVPAGTHVVKLKFTDTKVRILGNIITVMAIFFSILFFYKPLRLLLDRKLNF